MRRSLASGAVVSALLIGLIAPAVPVQGPTEKAVAAWLFGAPEVMAQSTAPAGAANKHMVEGRVTKVDAKRGWIDVKTPDGSMKLHFPPTALEGVKAGDNVSVELAMTTGPAPERSQKTK